MHYWLQKNRFIWIFKDVCASYSSFIANRTYANSKNCSGSQTVYLPTIKDQRTSIISKLAREWLLYSGCLQILYIFSTAGTYNAFGYNKIHKMLRKMEIY